jgi:hypothetical protein
MALENNQTSQQMDPFKQACCYVNKVWIPMKNFKKI